MAYKLNFNSILNTITVEDLVASTAATCINLNKQYVEMVGDSTTSTTLSWDMMPEAAQHGMKCVVLASINNPAKTAKESHDRWMASKLSQGWTYGEVADSALKQHPNLVEWDKLSNIEQFKDAIFTMTVLHAASLIK